MRAVDTLFGHSKVMRQTSGWGRCRGLEAPCAKLCIVNPFLVGPELLDAPA